MLLVGLSGCTNLRSREEAIERLDTVSVDDVVIPNFATYDGPESKAAAGDTGFPGAVAAGLSENKAERLNLYLQQHHIDAAGILKSEFIKALNRDQRFSGKVREQAADAHFSLIVQEYGLYEVIPFSARFVPRFIVRAQLVSSEGQVLWQHHGHPFYAEQISNETLNDLLADSYLMKDDFHQAAQEVSNELLFTVYGTPASRRSRFADSN